MARGGPPENGWPDRSRGVLTSSCLTQPEQRQRRPWGLAEAFVGFILGLTLSGILGNIWLAVHPEQEELSIGGQGFAQLGLWAGLVGAAVFASRRRGTGSLRTDFGLWFRAKDLIVGAVVGVLSQLLLVPGLALILRPLLGEPDVEGPTHDLIRAAEGAGLVMFVIFVTVGAPIVEELFFRGLVLRALERRFGETLAIVGSALLFGLAHPQPLPAKALALVMISLAVFGTLLGWLAAKSGRLGSAIVAHAVFNAWTVLFLLR
jgi:membrane protease YdiL (CAAX protease family)